MSYGTILFRLLARAAVRPRLLVALLGAAWRFRPRGWYRRPPFLPVPPPTYVRWRLHTAYGGEQSLPSVGELERYLRWSARMRQAERSGEVRG